MTRPAGPGAALTRCLLAFLVLAGLALPVPATADARDEVLGLLDRYVEASNRRDQAAILAVFDQDLSYLDIVRRSRPTLLDRRAFEAELPLLVEDWNRYHLEFSIPEIDRIDVDEDTAEAVFVLRVHGRWYSIPFVRRVLKDFRLIRRDSGWTIRVDRGEWLDQR